MYGLQHGDLAHTEKQTLKLYVHTEFYCAYYCVFVYSTLTRGIGGGLRSHKTIFNTATL